MSITIDGETFAIPIKTVKRKADFLHLYAERLENGDLATDDPMVYFNFDVECGMSANNTTDYAALFLKITEPVAFHEITMPAPDDYETFDCYFANVSDEVTKWEEAGTTYFRNLSFSVIRKSPARTP